MRSNPSANLCCFQISVNVLAGLLSELTLQNKSNYKTIIKQHTCYKIQARWFHLFLAARVLHIHVRCVYVCVANELMVICGMPFS